MQHIQLAAATVVREVLSNGHNLNQSLDKALREQAEWQPAQRAALQDMSYGTLRFYGQLHALLDLLLHKPLSDQRTRFLLLVAMYQLQYGKSAQHAVVDHAVRAALQLNPRIGGLVNATLRNFLRSRLTLLEQAAQSSEGRYSHPRWWMEILREQYGNQSAAILEACNQHPSMTLRVNLKRCNIQDYQVLLEKQGMAARRIKPGALQLDKPASVDRLPGFYEGLVSVQDAGAQYAAHLLDVRDGIRVLDACAAPGGKTAHILETANVQMVAVDKDLKRLERVSQNLQRLGLEAQLVTGDASRPENWWDGKPFERILADVPCTASGVARRHPDIKWLRRESDIAAFASQQLGILQALWRLLAQDGKLLYVTCSVFRQENDQVISAFLSQRADARQLPTELPVNRNGQLLPDDEHDGFFYALLQKI